MKKYTVYLVDGDFIRVQSEDEPFHSSSIWLAQRLEGDSDIPTKHVLINLTGVTFVEAD